MWLPHRLCYRQFPPKRQPSCPASSTGDKYLLSITSLPLGELPAVDVVSDGQPMAINLPKGIQRPGCSGRFSMRRASAPLLCIFWGSPDASCKVASLLVWRTKPVPEPSLLACCSLRRKTAVRALTSKTLHSQWLQHVQPCPAHPGPHSYRLSTQKLATGRRQRRRKFPSMCGYVFV